jgi:hypothetical protein
MSSYNSLALIPMLSEGDHARIEADLASNEALAALKAAYDRADDEYRALGVALDAARKAFRRSKSEKHAKAFHAADAACCDALQPLRAVRDTYYAARLRAFRMALVAPRRAFREQHRQQLAFDF